jgi:hypothetical protein
LLSQWHYVHSGLSIISELYLPEWKIFERPKLDSLPEITIKWHPCPHQAKRFTAPLISAEQHSFFVPEAGHFQVNKRGEVDIFAVSDPDMNTLRMVLLGTGWASVCYLRGMLLLHASVAETAVGAIAFCGESGAGKSSLVARLAQRACPILSDDLCRVVLDTDPIVYRSAGRIKLWRNAVAALDFEEHDLERYHPHLAKFHVSPPYVSERDFLPLKTVYILTWGELRLSKLTGIEALRRLIAAATYRGELLEPMGRLAGHWSQCAELIKQISIWELSRPRDWEQMDETVTFLLSSIGL